MLTLRRCILLFLAVTTFNKIPPAPPVQDWHKNPYNPVLYATQEWEQGNVAEPSVIYENGLFRMWYSAGNYPCVVAYAESEDGYGWRKEGVVLGGGVGGWQGTACRNNVIHVDDQYYAYFADGHSAGAVLRVATSADGTHFEARPQPVLVPPSWASGIANTTVWRDGSTWWVLFEAQAKGYPLWKIALAKGESPYAFTPVNDEPINVLQRSYGMWGGPFVKVRPDGSIDVWYQASWDDVLPTDIYYAHTKDLTRWKPHPSPVVRRSQDWWEVDQVADPVILDVSGQRWMFYDGCDNRDLAAVRCAIGVATLNQN